MRRVDIRRVIRIFFVWLVNNSSLSENRARKRFSEHEREGAHLENKSTEDILRWAVDRLGDRVAMGTAFGATGLVLLDIAQKSVPDLSVFTIESVAPRQTIGEQAAEHGEELYCRDADQCCYLRKVEPLHRKLGELDGWVTSLRRDQSETRSHVDLLSSFPALGDRRVAKINPMALWDRKRVWDYILEHEVPYNPGVPEHWMLAV